MARRIDLRAYQESIASQLAAAQAGAITPALLGFESGGTLWLVDLPVAGEVLPVPPLCPVPLTLPWFAGLANVRGELQAVVDFALFCHAPPTPREGAARLLRLAGGAGMTLLVGRVQGLKRLDSLFADEACDDSSPWPWAGESYRDGRGQRWVRLEADRLLADPRFLDAALPA